MLQQLVKDCSLWERPTREQGKSARRRERQRGTDHNPRLPSREERSEVEPEKRRGWGKAFEFCLFLTIQVNL